MMRVLLVEDDGSVRPLIADALREAGVLFVEARDGTAALDLLGLYPGEFDALVSDMRLPGTVDGGAVASAMRRSRPNAPIVLMSGSATALADHADLGAEILVKPFRIADLLRLLGIAGTGDSSGQSP